MAANAFLAVLIAATSQPLSPVARSRRLYFWVRRFPNSSADRLFLELDQVLRLSRGGLAFMQPCACSSPQEWRLKWRSRGPNAPRPAAILGRFRLSPTFM